MKNYDFFSVTSQRFVMALRNSSKPCQHWSQSSKKLTRSWYTFSHPASSLIAWSLNKNKSWSNQLLNPPCFGSYFVQESMGRWFGDVGPEWCWYCWYKGQKMGGPDGRGFFFFFIWLITLALLHNARMRKLNSSKMYQPTSKRLDDFPGRLHV